MGNLTKFKLSTLTLSLYSVFSLTAYAYQQGESETATVAQGEVVTKVDSVTSDNPKQAVSGELNRSGNPVRIIWYGNENDQDSKIAQTGASNQGLIHGKVVAQGQRSGGGKTEKWAEVNVEGQANAIDALGWSAPTNPNDIDITINQINNKRTAIGEAELRGGLSTVHGRVTTLGTANGISIMGTADFGQGSGIDGFSGATGVSSSASIRQEESAGPTLDDLEKEQTSSSKPADTSQSDLHGKDVKVKLVKVENSGELVGSLDAQASQGVKSAYTASYAPQFYGVSAVSSANGVSVATQTDTPDKYTYSEDKLNYAALGIVENQGTIQGKASLIGGQNVTHSQTKARGSANGISSHAATGNFAKHSTSSQVLKVENSGLISGELTQISGNNSAYKSNHLLSTAEAYGSGNGISAFTEAFNGQTKQAQAKVGDVDNSGRIEGIATLQAGNGTGDLSVTASSVGNGIASFSERGNTITGNVNNKGIISGQIETTAGIGAWAAKEGQTIPTEEAKLYVLTKQNYNTKPNVVPPKPTEARELTYSDRLNKTDRAESTIYASGNGISTLQRNHETAYMGDIHNKGVISGYAKMNHGFANGEYSRVNFLGTGTGIFLSNTAQKLENGTKSATNITNTGLISGNHAALLVKGKFDDRYSSYNPEFKSGYEGTINNYGLMAGTMIAGNYATPASLGSNEQHYRYFEAEQDPIQNAGTYVYLKSGIIPPTYWYSGSTQRNSDAEEIERIVVGSAADYTDPDTQKTYQIINGSVNSQGKDSDYTTADAQLENKIINGVGIENGALYTGSNLNLNNVIINGYRTALKLQDNADVTASNTILNTNGFMVNRQLKPYAILGSQGENRLSLEGQSYINGDIDLQAGDDTLTIRDNNVKMNGKILDLGEGNNTLIFGGKNSNATENTPIRVNYAIHNATTLDIQSPTHIASTAKIVGTDVINLANNLIYQVDNAKRHALYDENRHKDIQVNGQGYFILDVSNQEQTVGFGGFKLVGTENFKTTNVMQKVSRAEDGSLIITDINAEAERQRLAELAEQQRQAEEQARIEAEKAKQAEEQARIEAELVAKRAEEAKQQAQQQALADAQEAARKALASAQLAEDKTQQLAQKLAELTQTLADKNAQAQQTNEKLKALEAQLAETQQAVENAKISANSETSQKGDSLPTKTTLDFTQNLALLANTKAATTFLANSASLTNKGQDLTQADGLAKAEQLAQQAVNQYVENAKNHNIYGAVPNAMLDSARNYRAITKNQATSLPQGKVAVQAYANSYNSDYQETAKTSQTRQVVLGLGYGVNDQLTLGANLGMGKEKVEGKMQSELKGDSIYASLYAHHRLDRVGVTTGVAYQKTHYNGTRAINNGYDAQTFKAKFDPQITSLFAQAKYAVPFSDTLSFEPKMAVAYNHVTVNGFNEQGEGALSYNRQTNQNVELSVGQDLSYSLPLGNGKLTNKMSLDYVYNSKPTPIKAQFSNGQTFDLYTEHNQNLLRLGIASQYQSQSGFTLGLGVNTDLIRKSGSGLQLNSQLGYTF